MNEPTLLIITPDFSLAHELAGILRPAAPAWKLKSARESAEALRLAREAQPSLIIIGHELPDLSREALAREMREACPPSRILILAPDSNLPDIRSAIKAGVNGYILLSEIDREICHAVRQLQQGHFYASREVTLKILGDYHAALARSEPMPTKPLSQRERQVLQSIAGGCSRKEIAIQLNIGVRSVETYRRRLQYKTGCQTLEQFRQYAAREGFIHGAAALPPDRGPITE